MGDEAAGDRGGVTEPPADRTPFEKLVTALAVRHGVDCTSELEDLVETLGELACRDQDEIGASLMAMSARRSEGHVLAKEIQATATGMLTSLLELHAQMERFDEVVGSNPGLLEAIFDIDTGGPDNLFLPEPIYILQTFFRTPNDDEHDEALEDFAIDEGSDPFAFGMLRTTLGSAAVEQTAGGDPDWTALRTNYLAPSDGCPAGYWEDVDRKLSLLAALPVRSTLRRGPLPNVVLREALRQCRTYWTVVLCRPWHMSTMKRSMASLKRSMPTADLITVESKIELDRFLQGACELFVADTLKVSGIPFSVEDLASTWAAIDKV